MSPIILFVSQWIVLYGPSTLFRLKIIHFNDHFKSKTKLYIKNIKTSVVFVRFIFGKCWKYGNVFEIFEYKIIKIIKIWIYLYIGNISILKNNNWNYLNIIL